MSGPMTPARRHFLRVSAATAAAAAEPGTPVNATAYELMLAKLAEDRRRLKQVQSIERKVEVKRTLLPEYAPWVEGVLKTGRGAQDAVLMTVMVWRLDVGEFAGALEIAEYALKHDLAMPDQYKRDLPTVITEEVAEKALAAQAAGEPFPADTLAHVQAMTAERDMPDEVRAKLHKAAGLLAAGAAEQAGDAEMAATALEHLRRALQLHERVGVKKEIERLERFIKKQAAPPADPATTEGPDPGDG